jgi:hypothetical protein
MQFDVHVLPMNDAPEFVNLPDTVEFENASPMILTMGLFVEDKESADNELTWQFGVSDEILQYQFDVTTTNLTLSAPNFNGVVSLSVTVTDDSMASILEQIAVKVAGPLGLISTENQIPERFVLEQNYPNPFNPTTQIRFGLPTSGDVKIEVFNVIGEKVSTLWTGYLSSGYHVLEFDAGNLSSGIYIYRLVMGNNIALRKMILMR